MSYCIEMDIIIFQTYLATAYFLMEMDAFLLKNKLSLNLVP